MDYALHTPPSESHFRLKFVHNLWFKENKKEPLQEIRDHIILCPVIINIYAKHSERPATVYAHI